MERKKKAPAKPHTLKVAQVLLEDENGMLWVAKILEAVVTQRRIYVTAIKP